MTQNQTPTAEQTAPYVRALQTLEKNGFAKDPQWAQALRRAALSRFQDVGFPTARRGNEEWKYTDVRPIARYPFQPVTASTPTQLDAGELELHTFGGSREHRLVFVDGRYASELSSLPSLPNGVTVTNLADAMAAKADAVAPHLARVAAFESQGFTALNTAFVHDGGFIHLADRVRVEDPIHLLFLSTGQAPDAAFHPRVLIVTGQDSVATVVESYDALSESRYFTNAVTEIVAGPGSVVDYYKVQRQSEQAYHIATTQVEVNRDARFSSVNIDIGGGLVRNNLSVAMAGEGASCKLDGAYITARSQHVDNQVIIDHVVGHNDSREVYKGILDGKSRSVFHGSIIVREGAAKVNANQVDKNLLLSEHAEANTKPAFWIYCDDVRCGHGAACGKIDEDALFYLMSRGVNEETARDVLVRAFVSEIVDAISDESIRSHVDELVTDKLHSL